MKAIVKIQTCLRPYSGDFIAYKLVATVPNAAGKEDANTGERAPSFNKPYRLAESSHFTDSPPETFIRTLEFLGYDEIEIYD